MRGRTRAGAIKKKKKPSDLIDGALYASTIIENWYWLTLDR
jgi:hypothetical protein